MITIVKKMVLENNKRIEVVRIKWEIKEIVTGITIRKIKKAINKITVIRLQNLLQSVNSMNCQQNLNIQMVWLLRKSQNVSNVNQLRLLRNYLWWALWPLKTNLWMEKQSNSSWLITELKLNKRLKWIMLISNASSWKMDTSMKMSWLNVHQL